MVKMYFLTCSQIDENKKLDDLGDHTLDFQNGGMNQSKTWKFKF